MCASTPYPETFDSLIELMEYFNTEEKCIEYHAHRRWGDKPTCPHCEHEKVYKFSNGKTYKCAKCRKQFNVKTGTIFEESNVPLRKWFIAIYLLTSHKKGVSSHQLGRDIKVTQKTAWFMLQRIRHQLGIDNDPNEGLDGIIEVDETFVGGKNKNRHKDKKVKNSQGRSYKDKTPILGILQRYGKVKTIVIQDTKASTIQPLILQVVKPGSVLMSDEWMAYNGLNAVYDHNIVNHGAREYVNGNIFTNTLEGFWAWIKRMIMGTYHYVSRKHLQYYANEATFRYNTRNEKQGARLALLLSTTIGSLRYKELIN